MVLDNIEATFEFDPCTDSRLPVQDVPGSNRKW